MSDARRAHHSDTYLDRYGRSRDEFEKRREPTQRGLAGVARKHVSSRHNSRYAPYVKKKTQSWRVKVVEDVHEAVVARRREQESYARSSPPGRDVRASSKPTEMMEQSHQQNSGKRLASQIVTPNRVDQDVNVTKRRRDVTRVLSFSPKEDVLPMDAQIIGALNDMEIIGTSNIEYGTMMIDEQEDDLLGEELMDMETGGNKETEAIHKETNEVTEMEMVSSSRKGGHSFSSTHKGGRRLGIPLGLPNRKAEFLRRG
ncbi:hypothetical protein Bca101_018809 [Brassica carinata]